MNTQGKSLRERLFRTAPERDFIHCVCWNSNQGSLLFVMCFTRDTVCKVLSWVLPNESKQINLFCFHFFDFYTLSSALLPQWQRVVTRNSRWGCCQDRVVEERETDGEWIEILTNKRIKRINRKETQKMKVILCLFEVIVHQHVSTGQHAEPNSIHFIRVTTQVTIFVEQHFVVRQNIINYTKLNAL